MGHGKAAASAMLGSREAPLLSCRGDGEGWEPHFDETHGSGSWRF